MLIYLIILTVILNTYFSLCLNEGDADEVKSLPGLTRSVSFRQYSGYLNATKGSHFHYWFVESQKSPQKDPLILWLNGGPGCSSLGGFWTENGPFRVSSDGKNVVEDPYSWNTLANVLYLESPAGVGYSYQENNILQTDDNQTAKDNYLALQSFFKKFPQFKNNSFYITGESYAGVYIPMLALEILRDKSTFNLKGLAIGNGALDYEILFNSKVHFAHKHGIIDSNMYNELVANCCSCHNNKQECNFLIENSQYCYSPRFLQNILKDSGINPYNIYADCYPYDLNDTDSNSDYNNVWMPFGVDSDDNEVNNVYYSSRSKCVGNGYKVYMNSYDVRKAIHIPSHISKWINCKNPNAINYTMQIKSIKSQFIEIISKYKIQPFIVYNGDVDLVCDFLGDQQFVDGLGLTLTQKYTKWTVNGQNAGFVKRFNGLTFMTVRGAGHMVPFDKPEAALKIIEELIGISSV